MSIEDQIIQPLHDNVIVMPEELAEKSIGGIYLPNSNNEKAQKGQVLSVGNGRRNDKGDFMPLAVKPGDWVYYSKWTGSELKIPGKNLVVLKESDIFGIITTNKE